MLPELLLGNCSLTHHANNRVVIVAFSLVVLGTLYLPAFGESVPPSSLTQLKEEIKEVMDAGSIPGASIAVVKGDQVLWVGGLGKADASREVDVTADTLFRVGSVSKSFTALAVLKLVEQGRLDLDTPVRQFLPNVNYVNPWMKTHPITVAHLLEHTTGFDDIHFPEIAKDDVPNITLEAGLAFHPHSRVSRWPPGTHMSYSNSGPPIAALVLESITGQEFESFAKEHVFMPLGMADSTFRYPDKNSERLAKGHELDGKTYERYDHILFRPSGALNTSARDMSRYLRLMINRGELDGIHVFQPETIHRMERPKTTLAARSGHEFGYGLGNYAMVVAGHQFHGHDGSMATGFMATSAYSSDLQVGYFVALNTINPRLWDIAELIAKLGPYAGRACRRLL